MPLFLMLKPGVELDGALIGAISANCVRIEVRATFRTAYTKGEVVPRPLTHKKMEVVRKVPMGWTLDKAASWDPMMNPEAIEFFVRFSEGS
jgi:acetoacetyl-CoA synthetase